MLKKFSLPDYLKRINYQGKIKADLETLSSLMSHQLRSVPFENSDVQAGIIPSMEWGDIYSKIVTSKRDSLHYKQPRGG